MKKIFFVLLIGACLVSLTHKDSAEFNGKVVDDQTNQPIKSAKVIHLPSQTATTTDFEGKFLFHFKPSVGDKLRVSYTGYKTKTHTIQSDLICEIRLVRSQAINEVQVTESKAKSGRSQHDMMSSSFSYAPSSRKHHSESPQYIHQNSESYDVINENTFLAARDKALSTFSIDVDGAAYANVRRYITGGNKPPADAVRIEELINYFDYNYEFNGGGKPFGVHYEMGACPWNKNHTLLHIGIQGKEISTKEMPASNLVFLIDVSGSMRNQNKLPLLIKSFTMLVNKMRAEDKISIVTYAGRASIVLPPTAGSEKATIMAALDKLQAGGGTAGADGINTAYRLASEQYLKEGNNRVILATDGDFNIGISDNNELEKLIEEKSDQGIFLNVLGFGMGNYKDDKMQRLANKGNGQHAYIDNIHEARKIFVDELQGTLVTIAKDVKIQIEFNPAYVQHYRLIGYENRLLEDRDFNDDKKDAGEIGAGHSVTALYEIVPTGSASNINNIDPLKYQQNEQPKEGIKNGEWATLKIRHKEPTSNKSEKQTWTIKPTNKNLQLSEQYYWSAAMACFGMSLRGSDHLHDGNYTLAEELAMKGKGVDQWGYRSEGLNLIRSAKALFDSPEPAYIE